MTSKDLDRIIQNEDMVRIRAEQLMNELATLRYESGLSQKDLAAIAGVNQSSISKTESMKCSPMLETFLIILHSLGHTVKITKIGGEENENSRRL